MFFSSSEFNSLTMLARKHSQCISITTLECYSKLCFVKTNKCVAQNLFWWMCFFKQTSRYQPILCAWKMKASTKSLKSARRWNQLFESGETTFMGKGLMSLESISLLWLLSKIFFEIFQHCRDQYTYVSICQ